MATFVLLHRNFSPVHLCIYLTLKMYSMHRSNVGASLIEINELLDKQDTENESLTVCNENKRLPHENYFTERRTL